MISLRPEGLKAGLMKLPSSLMCEGSENMQGTTRSYSKQTLVEELHHGRSISNPCAEMVEDEKGNVCIPTIHAQLIAMTSASNASGDNRTI